MSIAALKQDVRKQALEQRAALKQKVPMLSRQIAENFLAQIPIPPGAIVSAYIAIGEEADPAPLLPELRLRGHVIALPRVAGRGLPLDFHRYELGANLVAGGFGLSEPDRNWPKVSPQLAIVPLLAFDAHGYRIGYGAGFYDRSLRKLRSEGEVIAAGYAFAVQEFASVPHDEEDERLDWIVTENGARKFS
jgi:5-formyltetrahydrofolate cyclo-ligase